LTALGKGEAKTVVTCGDRNRPNLIKCLGFNRRVEVEKIAIKRRVS
jgi:hypothetical protein